MNEEAVELESFTLVRSTGEPLYGDVRYCASSPRAPAVVICHSFMASKEWGFFPYAARALARAGFCAVTFNFSRSGVERNAQKITDFKAFEMNTVSHELGDLKELLARLRGGGLAPGALDPHRVALLGHSRGAGVAIVCAAEEPALRALVSWSAVSAFDRWTEHQKRIWWSQGYLPLSKDTGVSPLRMGIGLLEDLLQNRERLDILRAARAVRIPWLILHGRADVTVPVREAEALFDRSGRVTTRLEVLDQVGHLYNAASPEDDGYRTFDRILSTTIRWLQNNI